MMRGLSSVLCALLMLAGSALCQSQDGGKSEPLPSAPSSVLEQRHAPPAQQPKATPENKPATGNTTPPVEPAPPSAAVPSSSPGQQTSPESGPGNAEAKNGKAAVAANTTDVPNDQPIETIRRRVDEVNVVFTVTDKRGRFVKDLTQSDFKVRDDDKPPAAIVSFRSETNLPLRVGLLVDASNSVRDRFRFEQESVIEFLSQIIRHNYDLAFVLGFDTTFEVVQDFTDRTDKLAEGVHSLRPGGGTALYDAVFYSCRDKLMKTQETGPVRRAMILLSDGQDNQSRVTREEAIEMCQRADTVIYAISTNVSGTKDDGDKVLQRMTEATGGRPFFPFRIEEVANAFSEIQNELRSQYAMAYRPADLKYDGKFRSIEIEATTRKNLKVRTRQGWYAPRGTNP